MTIFTFLLILTGAFGVFLALVMIQLLVDLVLHFPLSALAAGAAAIIMYSAL